MRPVSIVLLGRGTVGGELLSQIAARAPIIRRERGVDLRLVGLVTREHQLFEADGLAPDDARHRVDGAAGHDVDALLAELARLPKPVLVDCTAADGLESLYAKAFSRGINVVAANKKPLALTMVERRALFAAARRHDCEYLYETTCGAGLPVIDTLKNLVMTGDTILRIEGSLSGTLGYLCDALMGGTPLSRSIQSARALGLTEPHPRDDLSGVDVARKALILARELGASLELDDIAVEPFVRAELLGESRIDHFMHQLESDDRAMQARIGAWQADGRVLRYLASIIVTDGRIRVVVGPEAVDASHPAASLRRQEAMVAFTTTRYREFPLVVRGAGAGGAVTASGVLADIVRLA